MSLAIILNVAFDVIVLIAVLRLAWWGITTARPEDGASPVAAARPQEERERLAA